MAGPLNPRAFADSLLGLIRERRSFGRHPLWHRIEQGRVDATGLSRFAVQFFLQVREFPRAVSALHARCPHPVERVLLAESLYEEETGRISGCNLSHPELFIRFGEALGLARPELVDGQPLPSTASLIHWFELSTQQHSFLEGAAAINLAAEGQVPGAFGPFARALEEHYGLSREAVAFWDIHEMADREHSDVGDHIVVRFADSAASQARVRRAVETSLQQWWQFFDGIDRVLDSAP
jgi:pyrroloquinoline-quinone synthase